MFKNNQISLLKQKKDILLLCIMVSILVLIAACGSSTTDGKGQSTIQIGQGGGPGSNNSAGLQQRPDPCTLISANQVQQLIPNSQFPAPTPGGNLAQGGIESSCNFTDANGITASLRIDPAEPTWSGMKSLQTNNPTGIPAIKGIGDGALFYGTSLCVLKGDYLLQVNVTNYNVSDATNQQQEEQIAQEALKKW